MKSVKQIHLIYFGGLLLLFFNDWIWKYQYHNWLTGKLSDFIGLLIFPIFISLFIPKLRKAIPYIIGIGFILWKMPVANGFIDWWNNYAFFNISRTIDYSDYIALLVLPLAYKIINSARFSQFINRVKWRTSPISTSLFTLASFFVFCSTSQVPLNYPKGDILIQSSYEIKHPKEYVLEKLDSLNIEVSIDSIYEAEFQKVGEKYYQIAYLNYGNTADTITNINFYLYTDNDNNSHLTIINMSIKENWKLQNEKEFKRMKKYYSKILEEILIDRIK